jgi:hypothetical protein
MKYKEEEIIKFATENVKSKEEEIIKNFKACLKHDDIVNKRESEEGDFNLLKELELKKTIKCGICKNIPVAPIVESKCC